MIKFAGNFIVNFFVELSAQNKLLDSYRVQSELLLAQTHGIFSFLLNEFLSNLGLLVHIWQWFSDLSIMAAISLAKTSSCPLLNFN